METTQLTDFLKVQSIQIAAVFAIVLILHWLLRHRSAHVRYLLWLLVAVKCMTPPLVSFSVPVLPASSQPVAVSPAQENHAEAWTPNTSETVRSSGFGLQEEKHAEAWTPSKSDRSRSSGVGRQEDKRAEAWTTNAMIAAVWSVGATLYFLWAIAKSVHLHRRLSALSRPVPESMTAQIDALARLWERPARFRVRLAESISQPFVWGLWRGAIYLPARLQSIETDRQRAVVMHEMAHVVRLDAFVNLLQILVQGIFWFHPLVWIANRFIRAEREKCCDETAVARLGAAPKEYGGAIVDTLLQEYQAGLPIPTLAVAGPVKNIEDRIKTLMQPNKRFYTRPTAIATLAILALAVLIVPTTVALTQKGGAKFFIDTTQGYMRCDVKIEELSRALLDMARTYQFNHNYAKNVGGGDNGPYAKYFTTQYTLPDTKILHLEAVSENKQPLIIRISLDDGACYTLDEITAELARRLKLLPNAKPLPVASLKASDSITPNPEQETQNFTATLPNGVTVELVGICEHPGKGKQWWKPDGTLLKQLPFDAGQINAKVSDWLKTEYEFAVLVKNPSGKDASFEGFKIDGSGSSSVGSFPQDGRSRIDWFITSLPKGLASAEIKVKIGEQWVSFRNVSLRPDVNTIAALTHRITRPDYTLSGMVADVNDKPIAGAIVFDDGYGPQPYQKGTTDADGKFEYKSWNEEHNITAKADGFQPQTRVFTTAPFDNSTKLNFKLKEESEDRSQETEKKPQVAHDVPTDYIGHWKGQAKIIVDWTKQKNLPIDITIHPTGKVDGTIGDAELVNGKLVKKSWVYTKIFQHTTPYWIEGDLRGDIIRSENIKRNSVTISMRVENGKIDGGLGTSGTKTGGKESMILSAMDVSLDRVDVDNSNLMATELSANDCNAKFPGKNPIYFDKQPQDNADIGLLARIEEIRQYETEVKGDWKNYWYFIRCSILQNTLGEYKDKELAFICYDAWPTPESGIMLKKAHFHI